MGQITLREDLHLLRHPFYQAWMEGTLSPEALRDYAGQYYHHVRNFPEYLKNAIELSEDSKASQVLAENLAEEDGTAYGTSHPELWLRFAEGVGAPRAEVQSAHLRKGIENVVGTFTSFSSASFTEALGSLYAYESQVPEIAHSKIEGLKKNFNVHDERTLAFFEIHKTADVDHRESLRQVIAQFTPLELERAQKAADAACQALWDFLSDVYEEQNVRCA